MIPGRRAKVAACVLNTTAEKYTLRQGEQLAEVDIASAVDLEVVGPLPSVVETTVEAIKSPNVGKNWSGVTAPPDMDARDTVPTGHRGDARRIAEGNE